MPEMTQRTTVNMITTRYCVDYLDRACNCNSGEDITGWRSSDITCNRMEWEVDFLTECNCNTGSSEPGDTSVHIYYRIESIK